MYRMAKVSKRARFTYVTVAALSTTFMSSAAWADCVNQGPVHPEQVVCGPPGTQGYNGAATNGLAITVQGSTLVQTNVGGPALISAGTGSSLINFSGSFNNGTGSTRGIDAGTPSTGAVSLGGGSQMTNGSDAFMRGAVSFGSATGANTNILNNNYSHVGSTNLIGVIDGNITSAGNTTINNQGGMGAFDPASITQTGAGTVVITNGVVGGYASAITGGLFQNSVISAQNTANPVITTAGNTTLTNLGGGNGVGALILGSVSLGSGGTGTSSITNGSQAGGNATINGNVTMADRDNTITNDGTITGNVVMNGTGSNTYNAGSSGSSGDNGLRLPGSAINGSFLPTGTVTGSLTGLAANSANNTLNLNGTGASTMQVGSTVNNFGTVNKNNSGTWTIKNTLDGAAGKLTKVNVNGGTLSVDNASFLGGSGSVVSLFNSTTLNFNGTANGNFAGNIVDGLNQTTGAVTVTGANTTTLSGTNSYHGTTTIDGGKLTAASNGALSSNSDFTIKNGGLLTINNNVQTGIKSLTDAGTGPNTVNLNGTGSQLTLTSGTWGANFGTITGNGTLVKSGAGALTLGTNGGNIAVDLTAPGTFKINDGSVNVNAAGAIGATTAVQVNSGVATTGILNVNQDDTIGNLSGTGANAQVNIATTKTLTTGGLGGNTLYAGHIAGAGALAKVGSGQMTLTGSNSYTGGTTITGTGGITGFAGTGASLQGNISVAAGANVTFDQASTPPGGAQSGTYAGQLSGAGLVVFAGNGSTTLTLSGNNSGLTGSMRFLSGTVAIGAANNVGVGLLDFQGGTLRNTATLTLANAVALNAGGGTFLTDPGTTLTLNGIISGAGGLTKNGTGVLVLGGANTYSGGSTVNAGTLQGQAGVGLQGNISVNNGALVKFTGAGTYAGALTGGGAVEIAGAGTTTFTNTGNTYSDNTTIDLGATLSAGLNMLSPNSGIIDNGTLTLTGNNSINRGLGGSGVANLGGNNFGISTSGNYNFTGQINGPGNLTVNSLAGSQWTFSGTTGTALTSFTNNGSTILNGSLAATTGTNSATGVLSGNGTFTGAFTNNGTIKPGSSPGILHFVGSYTQGATGSYVVDLNANNSSVVTAGVDYDQIQVSGTPGTATLGGNLTINQNGGEFVNGTVYHILTTSTNTAAGTNGTIIGNFSTFTGLTISPFIQFIANPTNPTAHTGDYTLTVLRSNYNTVANNPNQAAVAGLTSGSGLQGLVGVANAVSAVARIDNMSAGDARTLFDQVSPEAYGAYATALQDQGNLFSRQVAHRLAGAKGGEDAKMAIWGNLYGQWGNGKHSSFRHGSDQDIMGGALGVDGNVGGDLTLGAAVGYSEDKLKYRLGNSKGKSKSWQAGAYAGYHPDKLAVDVQVDYIHGKMNANKAVSVGSGFSATSGVATASTSGSLFKVIGTVGYQLGSDTMAFEPFVGVDFTTGHLNAFNEHGTMGALAMHVGRIKADRTDLLVGFKFAPNMGSLTPYADATLRYGLKRNSGNVRAYFDGLSSDLFTVSAQRSNKMQGELDAGLSYAIGKTSSIFFGYAGTIRSDLTEHGVNGGVKFAF
jgi:autotransporter-associated beta strand protein